MNNLCNFVIGEGNKANMTKLEKATWGERWGRCLRVWGWLTHGYACYQDVPRIHEDWL